MVFSESTSVEFSFLDTTRSSLDLHSNNQPGAARTLSDRQTEGRTFTQPDVAETR
jgi:hypothetical protein